MFSIHSSPVGKLGTRDTGGMSVYIRSVARELGALGHTVDIYTGRSVARGPGARPLGKNVNLIQLNGGNGRQSSATALYRRLPAFLRELEAYRSSFALDYDLIHSHYWLSGCLGRLAQSRWRKPHVITFHTLGAAKDSIKVGKAEPALRLKNELNLTASCHLIVSATERERELLSRHYHAAPGKVVVVPCGVDFKLFRPLDRPAARRNLGVKTGESIVLYVGRFEPLKGIDRLLQAVAVLNRQRNLRVIIVGGDGPRSAEEKRLRRIVRASGLNGFVRFAGRVEQNDLPLYYNAADVLVVPSFYESFGLVALEALACGTPVVSTAVGAIDSILVEGRTGYVVDNSGYRGLADGIGRLLFGAGSLETRLTREEIRSSVLRYSWSSVAAALSQEYENIIGPGGRP